MYYENNFLDFSILESAENSNLRHKIFNSWVRCREYGINNTYIYILILLGSCLNTWNLNTSYLIRDAIRDAIAGWRNKTEFSWRNKIEFYGIISLSQNIAGSEAVSLLCFFVWQLEGIRNITSGFK